MRSLFVTIFERYLPQVVLSKGPTFHKVVLLWAGKGSNTIVDGSELVVSSIDAFSTIKICYAEIGTDLSELSLTLLRYTARFVSWNGSTVREASLSPLLNWVASARGPFGGWGYMCFFICLLKYYIVYSGDVGLIATHFLLKQTQADRLRSKQRNNANEADIKQTDRQTDRQTDTDTRGRGSHTHTQVHKRDPKQDSFRRSI